MKKICKNPDCKKEFEAERDRRKYCSLKCSATNSTKIANKESHKVPKVGDKNPNWKNGRSKDNYYYRKRQKIKFPLKNKAREILQRAVKSGKIEKPNYCSNCGVQKEKNKIEGHHEDYNQPLKVEWLCKYCHRQKHE